MGLFSNFSYGVRLNDEVRRFYRDRKIPVTQIINMGIERRGLHREQMLVALKTVYENTQVLMEELSAYPAYPLFSPKEYEKLVLLRNCLRTDRIGREIFRVAKNIDMRPRKIMKKKFLGDKLAWQYTQYL
jgi:hypothetical protein